MKKHYALSLIGMATLLCGSLQAQISIPTVTPYSQDFDAIGTAASWTMPTDWRMSNGGGTVRANADYSTQSTSITGQIGGNNVSSSAANGL